MTAVKTSAFVLSLLVAMALGVWVGPHIVGQHVAPVAEKDDRSAAPPTQSTAATTPAKAHRTTAGVNRASLPSVRIDDPNLHARLQPLLFHGADMTIAARDFRSAEQFAAVAHAARNTKVPFMLLKYRVVTQHKTLATAIRESEPAVNAEIEAQRAVAEARSDLAALAT